MGIPSRFGIPSDTIIPGGLRFGHGRVARSTGAGPAGLPTVFRDLVPESGIAAGGPSNPCPDDGRACHRAVMWPYGQARPQAGGACRRLCGGPQHAAAGLGRHFAADRDRRDRAGGHLLRRRHRFGARAGRSRKAAAAVSLWGGLRDGGLWRDRLEGCRSGRCRPGLRALRADRARARRPTSADGLARRQQACPWASGRLRLAALQQFNDRATGARSACAETELPYE
jgi:hypothetical protein